MSNTQSPLHYNDEHEVGTVGYIEIEELTLVRQHFFATRSLDSWEGKRQEERSRRSKWVEWVPGNRRL